MERNSLYLIKRTRLVLCAFCLAPAAFAGMSQRDDAVSREAMRQMVTAAGAPSPAWTCPRTGPAGVTGKTVAIIAEDRVSAGFSEWQGVSEAGLYPDFYKKLREKSGWRSSCI